MEIKCFKFIITILVYCDTNYKIIVNKCFYEHYDSF